MVAGSTNAKIFGISNGQLTIAQAEYAGGAINVNVKATLPNGATVSKPFALTEGDYCADATVTLVSTATWTGHALATKNALITVPDKISEMFISSKASWCAFGSYTLVDDSGAVIVAGSANDAHPFITIVGDNLAIQQLNYQGGDVNVNVKATLAGATAQTAVRTFTLKEGDPCTGDTLAPSGADALSVTINVDEQLSTTLDLVEAFTSSESLCKTLKYALIKGADDTVEPDKSRFSVRSGRLYA